jgi:tetratricopeptide (TPR) repeat protein
MRSGWRVMLLALMTVAAYHNSFSVPFLFDDVPAIVENPALRQFSPGSLVGIGQPGGLTTSGRPVVALTLAANRVLGGDAVQGYHVTNLLIHLCAGLCMYGIVRRTLLQPTLRPRFGATADSIAWVVAAAWTLHPLQTESVTYIVQRAESLAGLLYLLTLYAFIRSTDATHPNRWRALAFLACVLGVGSKEVVASAPLVVWCYDRTFVSGTFRAAWQRHRGVHLILLSSWVALAALIFATGGRGGTTGFSAGMTSWSYGLTQFRAVVRYITLSFWPGTLIFDYGLATDRRLVDVLPQALAVLTLLGGVVVALRRWPAAGFLGVWFFALLAPSSSVVPVVTQTVAEHRMYLPLSALLTAAVVGWYRLAGGWSLRAGGAAAVALALATLARNHDYRSDEAIWRDTAAKLPTNARAHNNLGQALFRLGEIDAAMAAYERALALQPRYPETHYNLAVALARTGDLAKAIEHYVTALRFEPNYAEAHNNLGNALVAAGRMAEAIPHYEQALATKPLFAEAHNNLANALLQLGRGAEAQSHLARAVEVNPRYPEANYNLGNALAAAGRMNEALAQYLRALELRPDYAEAHVNAGNALLALERPVEAIAHYRRAVALRPQLADGHFNLGSALLDLGRWDEAIAALEGALRTDRGFVRAHRALGFALAKSGRLPEAISHYEEYVRAVPDDAEARAELQQLRTDAFRRR